MKKYFSKGGVGAKDGSSKGFTLIELLVVIAIIAILSAMIMTSIYGSRTKARDAKRISDIAQIQLALEQYFDRCRAYPSALSLSVDDGCKDLSSIPIKLGNYISVLPTDPQTKHDYDYATNGSNSDYVLHALLEKPNSATADGLNVTTYSISCSSSDINYCVGPK